jgi:hypothetical protein
MNIPEEKKSLSRERFEESLKRKYKIAITKESEEVNAESLAAPDANLPEEDKLNRSEEKYFGDDVVVSPLAYYTAQDSLKHALEDYKDQIARTVPAIMEKRKKYGQYLAMAKDRDDVLGEYPEKCVVENMAAKYIPLKIKRHYFTRPINGIMCRICIDEERTGVGQNKRNTYMLIDIAVIFYRKNGIGLGKEIVVRSKILRRRKRVPKSPQNK